jgi:hypothetical protein
MVDSAAWVKMAGVLRESIRKIDLRVFMGFLYVLNG